MIELWSNKDESIFGVKLSTDQEDSFRAIVSKSHYNGNNDKFIKIVDQMYYDESSHYDWPFMLEKWIEAWKSGFRHSASIIVPSEFQRRYSQENNDNSIVNTERILSFEQKPDGGNTKRPRKKNNVNRKKPSQKCHYCNLMFYDATGRSAHEETWHADKLLKYDGDRRSGHGVRNGR